MSKIHLVTSEWLSAEPVELCGHATLAASHFLFNSGLVKSNTIEFSTLSGILTAKRIPANKINGESNGESEDSFYIELDFPVVPVSDYNDLEVSAISEILNGVSVVDVKINTLDDIYVELSSAKELLELKPQIHKIKAAPGRGIVITARAPDGSGFDFYSRFFCPKYGIDEVILLRKNYKFCPLSLYHFSGGVLFNEC
ncbi:putative phenazine biosynthesis PhzF protein [Helianthus annuus]|nr:putative phenazine biosynthesis PhzF protein [Helianthus annuus]